MRESTDSEKVSRLQSIGFVVADRFHYAASSQTSQAVDCTFEEGIEHSEGVVGELELFHVAILQEDFVVEYFDCFDEDFEVTPVGQSAFVAFVDLEVSSSLLLKCLVPVAAVVVSHIPASRE